MSTRALGLRRRRVRRPLASGAQKRMNRFMVDRMMWRTGFGPSDADRKRWIGRSVADFVNSVMRTPQGPLRGPAPSRERDGARRPLDPTDNDTDLVLEWCDRMIRRANPFAERLAFFWHRHFATQRNEVSPPQLMQQQIELFRKYSDLAANPDAKFTDLMYEVGENPAMLRFLNGEYSTARNPNENYGREICELFALGVTDRKGNSNYSEQDIKELSRAFTGWQIDDDDPARARGVFTEDRWDDSPKKIFGRTANFKHRDAVDVVLKHWSHPYFICTRLWEEFITVPAPKATINDLMRTYRRGGTRIRPVIQKILNDPLMWANNEPDMIKPPVVFAVGCMRQLRRGITSSTLTRYLDLMGQEPYFPPTVAGWEGGLSWLNTNTALARFNLANALIGDDDHEIRDPGAGETHSQAFNRAYAAVGKPWLAPKTKSALLYYARNADSDSENDRVARQRVLRTFMLGGPDSQVM